MGARRQRLARLPERTLKAFGMLAVVGVCDPVAMHCRAGARQASSCLAAACLQLHPPLDHDARRSHSKALACAFIAKDRDRRRVPGPRPGSRAGRRGAPGGILPRSVCAQAARSCDDVGQRGPRLRHPAARQVCTRNSGRFRRGDTGRLRVIAPAARHDRHDLRSQFEPRQHIDARRASFSLMHASCMSSRAAVASTVNGKPSPARSSTRGSANSRPPGCSTCPTTISSAPSRKFPRARYWFSSTVFVDGAGQGSHSH